MVPSRMQFLATVPANMFSMNNVWIVMSEEPRLGDLYFPIDSQVYTFQVSEDGVNVRENYKIDRSMNQISKHYGTWREWRKPARLVLDEASLFERRKDFMGYSFDAEYVVSPPYVIVESNNVVHENENIKLGGIIGEIWHNDLEKRMNFTTKIRPSPDNTWGALKPDGTWNGIINGLIQNRTQIGLSAFFITYDRLMVADASPSFKEGSTRIFIKYPSRGISWTTFLDPVDFTLWIATSLLISLFIFLISLTYYFGPENRLNPDSFSAINSWLTIWGSLMTQGASLDPKSFSSKLIFLVSFLFGVIFYASFSSMLISFLTVIKLVLPFTSLEEIERTDYQIFCI